MLENADIFVTGGAGTLGLAIAKRRQEEEWEGKLTVYSTDSTKHEKMRRLYPDVIFIPGDVRIHETLYNAMCGHDVVIHAAAVKRIPEAEWASVDCIDVNVAGSQNVCFTAIRAGVKHVLGISTDKACHPANAYGASKMMMEKIFQEYARLEHIHTEFHLARYGNVIESTGSVVEAWKNAAARGEPVRITDESMTRFWLSPSQAVGYVIDALEFTPGWIYIPKMPALSIGKLLEYTAGKDIETQRIPLRPGEKMHETLVTKEELARTEDMSDYFLTFPSTADEEVRHHPKEPYTSETARELTGDELEELLNG